ncbi:MAG: SUMF1/EgtB/PvdO family nonheme iron enzyme [Gammaproteobacteria bacterium]|nr:SUMF1/EgtB/PvdO family nonheme iron enzyme [Gammaproteobacteria bacterium]
MSIFVSTVNAQSKVYQEAVALAEVERRLIARLEQPAALDVAATAEELARLRARHGERYAALAARLADVRAGTLLDMARRTRPIGAGLAAPLAEYRSLFAEQYPALAHDLLEVLDARVATLAPASVADIEALAPVAGNITALPRAQAEPLRRRLVGTLVERIRARGSDDAAGARDMLAAALSLFPGDRSLIALGRELPLLDVTRGRASLAEGRLGEARRSLDAAAATDPEHPSIAPFRDALERAMLEAEEAYAAYARDITRAGYHEQRSFDKRHADIIAMWQDNPTFVRLRVPLARTAQCSADLAGYGARPGGTCYDLIANRKGPEMVVVPAGDGVPEPFAIGRFEVSGAEFAQFCEQTRRCEPPDAAHRRLPVTGVAVDTVEAYARWLSERASEQAGRPVVYRLPTDDEWRHAAEAGGEQPEHQFNCRVVSVGEVINGHALVEVESGRQNGWGLANYSGNAREWVRDGERLAVRGGAYTDPLTACGPGMRSEHGGEGDELTGFRLVRELSG